MSHPNIPTPHNKAQYGDFARTVLMPGDPLRAKMVAEKFLEEAVLVNNVRGVQGYTGNYKGKRVSVMASGMGMPAIGIYAHELYNHYGVENIIRIGSAGGIQKDVKVRDIICALSCYTDSSFGAQFGFNGVLAPCASYELLTKAVEAAKARNAPFKVGPIYSSDVFYNANDPTELLASLGVLGVEMEAYALYLTAARAGKNALCVCTVTDHMLTHESLPAADRQMTLTQMIEIALEIA